MLSLTHFNFPPRKLVYLNPKVFDSVVLVINPRNQQHPLRQIWKLREPRRENQVLSGKFESCGVLVRCKRWESEGDWELEAEVFEFMKNSKNPEKFPSKKELVEAGRVDLVEGILNRGGWMVMGWEMDEERESFGEKNWECGVGNGRESEERMGLKKYEDWNSGSSSSSSSSSSIDCISDASCSGRSLEIAAEDTGIEGILNGLEKERTMSLGLSFGRNGSISPSSSSVNDDGQHAGILKDADSRFSTKSVESTSLSRQIGVFNDIGVDISLNKSPLLKPNSWRTWSAQRAGFSDKEFEAAEIIYDRSINGTSVHTSMDEISAVEDAEEPLGKKNELNSPGKGIDQNDIRARLQHLELELSSVLQSVRSNVTNVPYKSQEQLSDKLRMLSDTWEFQENEIMNAQDRLRSLRAKLTVLEGKMSLAIIDAQRITDEKQKRIDDAHRALKLLRTTCVVWANSASEVLLAGSFDGWTTQRKMERSNAGVFSVSLKLYPGKYEIKFIVDGEWKVDPLRPIVHNNGYENNLLIVN